MTVEKALERYGAPIYVRKQIVQQVVEDLERRGAVFVEELADVPEGALVVFSAHGVSPMVHAEADRRGLRTIDATCPLVTKVHNEARRFAKDDLDIVLIGHDGHEEVEGTSGRLRSTSSSCRAQRTSTTCRCGIRTGSSGCPRRPCRSTRPTRP